MKRLLIILLFVPVAWSDQEGSLNTNNVESTVNSNNQTTDTSTSNTYNGAGSSSEIPVGSAISPSYMSNGMDTCLKGTGGSLQTVGVGFSSGGYKTDPSCERLKEAKLLADLGAKVSAFSRLCESVQVFRAMLQSSMPCPNLYKGKFVSGKKAMLIIKKYPDIYIPDYKDNKDYYNVILGIGEVQDEENSDDSISISDRFRTSSIKP